MKQTAVDYLIQELFTVHDENFDFNPVFEKAKEMEKEQMKLACVRTEYEDKAWQKLMEKQFEQWYNETFKPE
jgi:hypothetical protein